MSPRIPLVPGWIHRRKTRELFRPFVRPGDVVFDVGAHHGSAVEAFLALGARVVAVEPRAEVLAGLGRLLRALCFEAVDRLPGVAEACVRRLEARAPAVYNLRSCDQPRFDLAEWVGAEGLLRLLGPHLARVRHADVFARFDA